MLMGFCDAADAADAAVAATSSLLSPRGFSHAYNTFTLHTSIHGIQKEKKKKM